MSLDQYLNKDLKEVSLAFRSLSEDEVSMLLEEVLTIDSISKCKFARLLVCRADAARIMSLLGKNDPDLVSCCSRYLKTNAIRKVLYAMLKDKDTFITLYDLTSELGKNALLECLVWNKERPAQCLADQLYDSSSLFLNEKQRYLLASACSVEKYATRDLKISFRNKPFYQQRRKAMEEASIKSLYSLYLQMKENSTVDLVAKCDRLIPNIYHWYKTWTFEDVQIRAYELVLNIWIMKSSNSDLLMTILDSMTNSYIISEINGEIETTHSLTRCKLGSFGNMKSFMCALIRLAPFYVMKKCKYLDNYSEVFKYAQNPLRFIDILCYIRNAYILGETEFASHFINCLATKDCLDENYPNKWERIRSVLTKTDYDVFVSLYLKDIKKQLIEFGSRTYITYSNYPKIIQELVTNISHSDETLLSILDIYFTNEKFFKDDSLSSLVKFYGNQIKLIPLDFTYQMATNEMMNQYSTVHLFESLLCRKGNTILNCKESSDRMMVLKSLLRFASDCRDVFAIHRCLNIYTKTEMKFSDITLDLSDSFSLFSPISLGMSDSLQNINCSFEDAKKGRESVISILIEWGLMKKGDLMVKPLMFVLSYLFTYASMYPQYEEDYCSLMKPIITILINKRLVMTSSLVESNVSFADKRIDYINNLSQISCSYNKNVIKCFIPYINIERYMNHIDDLINYKYSPSRNLIIPTLLIPSATHNITPMSSICLKMIIGLINTNKDIEINYILYILSSLIKTVIINEIKTIDIKTIIYENNEIILNKIETIIYESNDLIILRDLFIDQSIYWSGCLGNLSILQTVFLQNDTLKDISNYLKSEKPQSIITYETQLKEKKIPKKEKKSNLFIQLSSKESYQRYLINHGIETVNQLLIKRIENELLSYTQKLKTITNLSLSLDGLKWCMTTIESCSLYTLTNVTGNQLINNYQKLLENISNDTLLTLYKIASLDYHIVLQTILLVISINRSDHPILDANMVMNVQKLQSVFYNVMKVIILVNKQLQYRSLKPEIKEITINLLSPFLLTWLESIKEKTVLSLNELRKEDLIILDDAKPLSFLFDMTDNRMIGRCIELMVYSRTIKEFFGKHLYGFLEIVELMSVETVLQICHRLLIISTFVPYAESILLRIIHSTVNQSILQSIVELFSSCSYCMTVSLMSLIFRFSALPVLAPFSNQLKETIVKMTKYVIENDFQSSSSYVIILRWVFITCLTSDNPDIKFMSTLLSSLSSLNITEKAGNIVYHIVLNITRLMTGVIINQRMNDDTKKIITLITPLLNDVNQEKKDLLKDLLINMFIQFNVNDNEDIFIKHINSFIQFKLISLPEQVKKECENVLLEQWRPYDNVDRVLAVSFIVLYTESPENALNVLKQGCERLASLLVVCRKGKNEMTDEILKELDVDHRYYSYVRDGKIYDNIIDALCNNNKDLFTHTFRIEILSHLNEINDVLLPFAVYTQALQASIDDDKEEMKIKKRKIDMNRLVDRLEKTMDAWMYHSLMECDMSLLKFSDEQMTDLIDYFEKTQKEVAAVLVAASHKIHETDISKNAFGRVKNWVIENRVRSLYWIIE